MFSVCAKKSALQITVDQFLLTQGHEKKVLLSLKTVKLLSLSLSRYLDWEIMTDAETEEFIGVAILTKS